MYYLNFCKRLLSSLVIGGQAINFIFKGKISKNDLFDQLMESLLPDAIDEDPEKPAGLYTSWMVLIQ